MQQKQAAVGSFQALITFLVPLRIMAAQRLLHPVEPWSQKLTEIGNLCK